VCPSTRFRSNTQRLRSKGIPSEISVMVENAVQTEGSQLSSTQACGHCGGTARLPVWSRGRTGDPSKISLWTEFANTFLLLLGLGSSTAFGVWAIKSYDSSVAANRLMETSNEMLGKSNCLMQWSNRLSLLSNRLNMLAYCQDIVNSDGPVRRYGLYAAR
jgi:hypothetical protein